jgi:hypothetical protein
MREPKVPLLFARFPEIPVANLSDGLETRAPPYYKVHISVFAIIVTVR